MTIGIFDRTVVPDGWFDLTAQSAGWFDGELLEPLSSAVAVSSSSGTYGRKPKRIPARTRKRLQVTKPWTVEEGAQLFLDSWKQPELTTKPVGKPKVHVIPINVIVEDDEDEIISLLLAA